MKRISIIVFAVAIAAFAMSHTLRDLPRAFVPAVAHAEETPQKKGNDDAAKSADAKVPLFKGLGDVGRRVTTDSPLAQKYVDQGLCFLFAFNHDEAIRSFTQATEIDPTCAMAWWGIALANGPHINNPILPEDRAKAAWAALEKARAHAGKASQVEQALIDALGARYADPPPEDRAQLDKAYAKAMGQVWKKFPDDADVGAFYAEALMDLRPWDLYTQDKRPQPGAKKIVATLEKVIELAPRHPLALHLYIHAVEASEHPERADDEADRLRDLQPGLGHLVHMPSHIDVLRGRWKEAAIANDKAIQADEAYRKLSPNQGFYNLYMAHNHHMLAYAALMRGQSQRAIDAISQMVAGMPPEWVKENAAIADGFTAMPVELLVRFGRWDEILKTPEPPEFLPLARCLWRCARGVAYAAQHKPQQARSEWDAFLEARKAVPEDWHFGNNNAHDILDVAEHLLAGEILYREGKVDEGLAELRTAAACEDRLRYDEPPDWIMPVRHALGATLLQEGKAAEAEEVYRQDLARLPNNGWSLYGLARSLHLQGKHEAAAAADADFQKVWSDADVTITSSCFCQPGK